MKEFTKSEIERIEDMEDYQLSNGECIPAEYFLNEPKGSLSLIPDYDDDIDIFSFAEKEEKECDICGGDMTYHDEGTSGYWECDDCGHTEQDKPLRH